MILPAQREQRLKARKVFGLSVFLSFGLSLWRFSAAASAAFAKGKEPRRPKSGQKCRITHGAEHQALFFYFGESEIKDQVFYIVKFFVF